MKRFTLIITILLLGSILSSHAQIVQTTTGGLVTEARVPYISYRGSIEASGLFGNGAGFQARLVPLGLQFSPSLYVGLGVGISCISSNDNGDDKNSKRYKGESLASIFIPIKYSINALSFGGNKNFVPYASVILGVNDLDAPAFLGEARVGLTMLSKSKTSGLSFFLGYQAMESGYYGSFSGLNIGLSWEFGGKGGFNKRQR